MCIKLACWLAIYSHTKTSACDVCHSQLNVEQHTLSSFQA